MSLFALLEQQPEVPKFKKTNTTTEQAKALSGNITNLTAATELAGKTNEFNQSEWTKMLEAGLPGFGSISDSISSTIKDRIAGKLSPETLGNIQRDSAFKSLTGGFGSRFGSSGTSSAALTARDIGRTTEDVISGGLSAGTRWLEQAATTMKAPAFDVSSMFISPALRIGTTMANNENQWNRDWLSNQTDAAYDWRTIMGKGADSMIEGIKGAAASGAGSAAGGGGSM